MSSKLTLKEQMAQSLMRQEQERQRRVDQGETPEADDILGIELAQERVEIDVDLIDPSPYQPRLTFNKDDIEALAENIEDVGLNQPIVVVKRGSRYELVAGENRLRAFKYLKRPTIPCIIRHLDSSMAAKATISDNLQHRDITDYEIARGLIMLMDYNIESSVSGLARLIGRSRTAVQMYLAYRYLPETSKEILDKSPHLVGSKLMYKIKDFPAQGHGALVHEAIEGLASGKIKSQQSVEGWIRARINPKQARPQKRDIVTTDGKSLGTYFREGGEYRLKVNPNVFSPETLDRFEKRILEMLAELAETKIPEETE